LPSSSHISAARGPVLRCKGWRQEALLRMLENVIETGERPEDLVVYGGFAKAARGWDSYRRIVDALTQLELEQTLVVQSGKPIGVFRSHERAPLVLMATSNVVGRWCTEEYWYELEAKGKTMWGGYTAGDWQYIGSQGIVQGTYQTFATIAQEHFGGSLAGRLVVTAGLGGMGGAQPLAIRMAGAVGICVEVDPQRIRRRVDTGYLERDTDNLDEALTWAEGAMRAGVPMSIGLLGNAAEVLPRIAAAGITPDVVTDQTSAHDLRQGYLPAGVSLSEWDQLRREDPEALKDMARSSIMEHVRVMLRWQRQGAIAFEYGNSLRAQAAAGGVEDAFEIPSFMTRYLRPFFCRGLGPFRWLAISGEASDIEKVDRMVLDNFPENSIVQQWIPMARRYVRFQGLPARVAWLGHGERTVLAAMVDKAVADGVLSGPIAFTRDHLDAGGVCQPLRETEGMNDGTDAVSDWPMLNALLNSGNGADLVALHGGGGGYSGYYQSAGLTVVADGLEGNRERIESTLTADTGIGVLRYADAGYGQAIETVRTSALRSLQPEVGDV
jgi:urocanate hydratase